MPVKRFIEGGSKLKLRHGSKSDIAAAYDMYADMLYRLALSNLGNPEDAQDAVHDVFEKYISSPVSFADGEHEKAWFIRAVINRCRDIFRKQRLRNHTPLEEAAHIHGETDGESQLTDAISSLDEKYKTAVTLHYFEGFSVEETADILNISLSAAKMRLARGREKLKILLETEDY